jgi:hypothetical protein
LPTNILPITQSLDVVEISSNREHEIVQHRLYQTAKTVRNQIAKTFHEHHEKVYQIFFKKLEFLASFINPNKR